MFQQMVSQLTSDRVNDVIESAVLADQEVLERICMRLDRELPAGPYLTDKSFASLLGITSKRLGNRRCEKPGCYPTPLELGGCRGKQHVRSELINWLALEEVKARAQIVHRCL
jgi:hypothetical protein